MNQNTVEYIVKCDANRFNEIISKELKRKEYNKIFNLSGEYSQEGGFDIWYNFSLFTTEPFLGPLIKINSKSVNINKDNTESKLFLKRINCSSYTLNYGFSIIFIFLCFVLFIYQVYKNGFYNDLSLLILPLIGIIYFFGIVLSTKKTASSLVRSIEKLMISNKIDFNKL